MKKFILSFLLLPLWLSIHGQDLLQLYPKITLLTFNSADEAEFQKTRQQCASLYEIAFEDMTDEEKEASEPCDHYLSEDYYSVLGIGCSWYCGGSSGSTKASSFLFSKDSIYVPDRINDLNYKYAWVEGAEGLGIGEYVTFRFSDVSPRINKIIIANGYVKNRSAWENNARVKTLKLYINNKAYAILNLTDERADQSFEITPQGRFHGSTYEDISNAPDWTMKFEILEVYPGDKYEDVVISEIYFDGLDVHCLAAGTKISMADGSEKNIQEIKRDDEVLSYNSNTGLSEIAKVVDVDNADHSEAINVVLKNGKNITCTADHPLLGEDDIWYSADPDKTMEVYEYERVEQLKTGIVLKTTEGSTTVNEIQVVSLSPQSKIKFYTIVSLNMNKAFFANGVVVGTEPIRTNISVDK